MAQHLPQLSLLRNFFQLDSAETTPSSSRLLRNASLFRRVLLGHTRYVWKTKPWLRFQVFSGFQWISLQTKLPNSGSTNEGLQCLLEEYHEVPPKQWNPPLWNIYISRTKRLIFWSSLVACWICMDNVSSQSFMTDTKGKSSSSSKAAPGNDSCRSATRNPCPNTKWKPIQRNRNPRINSQWKFVSYSTNEHLWLLLWMVFFTWISKYLWLKHEFSRN